MGVKLWIRYRIDLFYSRLPVHLRPITLEAGENQRKVLASRGSRGRKIITEYRGWSDSGLQP